MSFDYKAAGVDIDTANRAKELMTAAVTSTHGASVLAGMGAFGGAFSLGETLRHVADPVLIASTDGVGTKTLIAAALGRYDTVGQDLVNHCVNDVLVQGARPLFFMDYIASARLEASQVAAIVAGVAAACREAGCALLGGETAEMPDVYAPGAFDLAGTMIGIVGRDQLIDGRAIQAGDAVCALLSSGLHTNGYSLARKACATLGYDARPAELDGVSLGEALLAVHRSYLSQIEALRAADVVPRGLAHITGGGVWENVPRILPRDLSVDIRRNSWPIPPIFRWLVAQTGIEEREAYRALNMGLGMIVVVGREQLAAAQAAVPELLEVGVVVQAGAGPRVQLG